MITKIKEWIIHRLNGKTMSEHFENIATHYDDGYSQGRYQVLDALVTFADSINGTDADTWCKQVYDKMSSWRDNCKEMINENDNNDNNNDN